MLQTLEARSGIIGAIQQSSEGEIWSSDLMRGKKAEQRISRTRGKDPTSYIVSLKGTGAPRTRKVYHSRAKLTEEAKKAARAKTRGPV